MPPNKSPEPTLMTPSIPHVRLTASTVWLSFFRQAAEFEHISKQAVEMKLE
jgi:hypothetical protein